MPSPSSAESRPTMRDVATVANVSFKTVARVVHGEPWVRAETAARVNAAIRQLGYQPNDIASSLKRGVSRETIGLVIADVANPFFSTIARAVEDVIRDRRLLTITASTDEDPERERTVIDSLVKQRVTGLLIVPAARDHRYLSRERRMGMPIVFMDRPPGKIRADTVLVDSLGGAQVGRGPPHRSRAPADRDHRRPAGGAHDGGAIRRLPGRAGGRGPVHRSGAGALRLPLLGGCRGAGHASCWRCRRHRPRCSAPTTA